MHPKTANPNVACKQSLIFVYNKQEGAYNAQETKIATTCMRNKTIQSTTFFLLLFTKTCPKPAQKHRLTETGHNSGTGGGVFTKLSESVENRPENTFRKNGQ